MRDSMHSTRSRGASPWTAIGLTCLMLAASPGFAGSRVEDARLETATVQRLRQSTVPGAGSLRVEADDGKVRLDGELRTLADVWRVVELAEQVHGVIEVRSSLDLRGGGRSAEAIERDIERAFANRPVLLMNEVEARVRRGGKVVLEGTLQDARTRFAARKAVASVEGVTEVIDRLETPDAPDELIANSLEEVFRRARNRGLSGEFETEVEGGVVTITGIVPRPFEKREATKLALGVNGVRRVENRLKVRPDPREIPVVRP
jgi:osmotically-inducible protein OsmY